MNSNEDQSKVSLWLENEAYFLEIHLKPFQEMLDMKKYEKPNSVLTKEQLEYIVEREKLKIKHINKMRELTRGNKKIQPELQKLISRQIQIYEQQTKLESLRLYQQTKMELLEDSLKNSDIEQQLNNNQGILKKNINV